jgi:ubiquitin-protein ligase
MYRPSKRPKVKEVTEWELVYNARIDSHWRGDAYNGDVEVSVGYPFPDFYKVTTNMGKPNVRTSKLFYGESAHNQTEMYVYDLGFRDVLGRI